MNMGFCCWLPGAPRQRFQWMDDNRIVSPLFHSLLSKKKNLSIFPSTCTRLRNSTTATGNRLWQNKQSRNGPNTQQSRNATMWRNLGSRRGQSQRRGCRTEGGKSQTTYSRSAKINTDPIVRTHAGLVPTVQQLAAS